MSEGQFIVPSIENAIVVAPLYLPPSLYLGIKQNLKESTLKTVGQNVQKKAFPHIILKNRFFYTSALASSKQNKTAQNTLGTTHFLPIIRWSEVTRSCFAERRFQDETRKCFQHKSKQEKGGCSYERIKQSTQARADTPLLCICH